jgi:protein-S-isoprenylcysteine O-methyltransferase Ste14
MSLVPAFEIGVWNAWIFTAAFFTLLFLPLQLLPVISKNTTTRSLSTTVPLNGMEKIMDILVVVSMVLLVIYSIFLPLQLGTAWFYVGLCVCALAFITGAITTVNWLTAPLSEPVTKGICRYSRHPIYLVQALMFIGIGIISASWVFILLSVVRAIATFIVAIPEEHFCLGKYGTAYREYIDRTPRWLGLPKPVNK